MNHQAVLYNMVGVPFLYQWGGSLTVNVSRTNRPVNMHYEMNPAWVNFDVYDFAEHPTDWVEALEWIYARHMEYVKPDTGPDDRYLRTYLGDPYDAGR